MLKLTPPARMRRAEFERWQALYRLLQWVDALAVECAENENVRHSLLRDDVIDLALMLEEQYRGIFLPGSVPSHAELELWRNDAVNLTASFLDITSRVWVATHDPAKRYPQ